ncbi:MAG: SMP-30/gluconolactonase/LRE family protein [Gammaproteobacteria bacterium]
MDTFEILDESFRPLVLPNAPLEQLADGFRWLEGPVWFADHQTLLFSDLPNDRIMRWCEGGGVSVFRQPSDFANGQCRDTQGRLISCSHRRRAILRTELDGEVTVLAERFDGRRLNSPNDVICKGDGSIWFTDPIYGISTDYEGGKQISELPEAVYRIDPDDSGLQRVAEGLGGPNGLAFSPDEQRLYLVASGAQFAAEPEHAIHVFDMVDQGRALAHGRVFHRVTPGHSDGIRCDENGRLWSAAGDGVHCFDTNGRLIGRIHLGGAVANIEFGGRYRSRLFICAGQALYAVYLNVRGAGWL